MTVLVTGGTGSIGAWVTHELLESGIEPIVFDVDPTLTYFEDIREKITLVEGDITNYDAIESVVTDNDVDRIIHLAKLLPKYSERNPLETLEVNVLGSGNVLRAAAENDIDRVVYSSSKSVFANITGSHGPPDFEPISEDYPKFDRKTSDQIPFYTVTNKMVEYFGIRYAMSEGLEFVILRFGSTWGPGKNEIQEKYAEETRKVGGSLICEMIDRAMRGASLTVTEDQVGPDNATYTKDLATGIVRAANSEDIAFENNHREFLLDGGRTVSHTEIGEILRDLFPEFAFSVTQTETDEEPHRKNITCRFDLSRSKAELGYEPQFGAPEDAIEDYIETNRKYVG